MNINNREDREGGIVRTGIIGIIVNLALALIKALISLSSGSVAVLMDAVNNLSDVLSSLIAIAGTKLASLPPDHGHPMGHGRIEYLSTVAIAFLVLLAGVSALRESILKILSPDPVSFSVYLAGILLLVVFVKLILGRYTKRMGERLNADTLRASGYDALLDAVISFFTFIGAMLQLFFRVNIDGWIGAAIALLVIKTGTEIFREALDNIIGRRTDPKLCKAIKKKLCRDERVRGVYDLVLMNLGPDRLVGSVYIEVSDRLLAGEVYELTRTLRKELSDEFDIAMTIGIYAFRPPSAQERALRKTVEEIVASHEEVLEMHDFYLDAQNALISFDIAIEFSVRDRAKYGEDLRGELKAAFPEYEYDIQIDLDYRD